VSKIRMERKGAKQSKAKNRVHPWGWSAADSKENEEQSEPVRKGGQFRKCTKKVAFLQHQ